VKEIIESHSAHILVPRACPWKSTIFEKLHSGTLTNNGK